MPRPGASPKTRGSASLFHGYTRVFVSVTGGRFDDTAAGPEVERERTEAAEEQSHAEAQSSPYGVAPIQVIAKALAHVRARTPLVPGRCGAIHREASQRKCRGRDAVLHRGQQRRGRARGGRRGAHGDKRGGGTLAGAHWRHRDFGRRRGDRGIARASGARNAPSCLWRRGRTVAYGARAIPSRLHAVRSVSPR